MVLITRPGDLLLIYIEVMMKAKERNWRTRAQNYKERTRSYLFPVGVFLISKVFLCPV